jgi:hypothetical protein
MGQEDERACRPAIGWIKAIRTCGRCGDPEDMWWPDSAPGAPPGRISNVPPGMTTKMAERRSTREEDPRLRPSL